MTLKLTGYRGLHKIISGGQTGADQGGLLAAHVFGILTGGTAPDKYMTSKGSNLLLEAFGLKAVGSLQSRTRRNIVDSDATVILAVDMQSPGTIKTRQLCMELKRPFLAIDLTAAATAFGDTGSVPVELRNKMCEALHAFILEHRVGVLNVAGNRERHEDNRITHITALIIGETLDLLDIDNLIIRHIDF